MSNRNHLQPNINPGKNIREYKPVILTENLTGSQISIPLVDEPINYILVSAYITINGTPTSNNVDTNALMISIGTGVSPFIYGNNNILGLTGNQNITLNSAVGFRGNENLSLFLIAKLNDDPGNLEHIIGLQSIQFHLYYVKT